MALRFGLGLVRRGLCCENAGHLRMDPTAFDLRRYRMCLMTLHDLPGLLFAAAAGLLVAYGLAADTAVTSADEPEVRAFFTRHCLACHGPEQPEGDLQLDSLAMDYTSPGNLAHWEEIMNRINSGDMPPRSKPRPPATEIARVAEWIAGQLREAEAVRQSSASEPISFRKLTREEYANTIRDLLGVEFDVKSPTGLPEDPDWKGFERIGQMLTLSPAHVEKYLAAAETVLDEALSFRPEPQREIIRWTPFELRYGKRTELEARGIADQVRMELIPNNHLSDT